MKQHPASPASSPVDTSKALASDMQNFKSNPQKPADIHLSGTGDVYCRPHVAAYAIRTSRQLEINTLNNFLSAKNSQPAWRLAWCFFASGMGSWTLFSFPEIGVIAGAWGVIGYTLSGVLGLIILAVRFNSLRVVEWKLTRSRAGCGTL
jgi:hypothetical protein